MSVRYVIPRCSQFYTHVTNSIPQNGMQAVMCPFAGRQLTHVFQIVANVFVQLVVLLYLIDNNEQTSWMILMGSGVGVLIEAWKVLIGSSSPLALCSTVVRSPKRLTSVSPRPRRVHDSRTNLISRVHTEITSVGLHTHLFIHPDKHVLSEDEKKTQEYAVIMTAGYLSDLHL